MVNTVLHVILFQPFEYQGEYTSFWYATKQPRTYDVLLKDCNSHTKDAYISHSSFVFFTCLWITSTFIFYVKNDIQNEFPRCVIQKRRSAADIFHTSRRIPIEKCDFSRVELTLLHGCSPVNWLNVGHLPTKYLLVFKTSWRHLARRFEDVLEDEKLLRWRCLEDMSWRQLEDVLEINKMFTGDICI